MKTWIWIGIILFIVGLVLFVVTMSIHHWDFKKLSSASIITQTYTLGEAFSEITLDIITADVQILPSEDGKCKIISREYEEQPLSVTVTDGKLTVAEEDNREWYDYIGFYFESPKITVYLPEEKYNTIIVKATTGDVKIAKGFTFEKLDVSLTTGSVNCQGTTAVQLKCKTVTGHIFLKQVEATGVDLSANTGDISLKNISCQTISVKGNTSEIEMYDVIAEKNLIVKNGTGDVEFTRCDAGTVEIRTNTGDIEGSFLTGKVFDAKTTTGDMDLPTNDREGGDCTIRANTGDIDIRIKK